MTLARFAEDPGAFIALGPGDERIANDEFCVTFLPGKHFWSTSVCRVRAEPEAALNAVRTLMRERGRSEAAWTIGPSSPPEAVEHLIKLGLDRESQDGSVILTLTEAPLVEESLVFEVRQVSSLEDHLAALTVQSEGFGFSDHDARDERDRALQTFEAERAGGHVSRLVAFDGGRPIATGHGRFSRMGLYVGGGATLPTDRGRGAFSALLAEAWRGAVARGTPAIVTFGGAMSAPILQKMGFRPIGRVTHLIDRI